MISGAAETERKWTFIPLHKSALKIASAISLPVGLVSVATAITGDFFWVAAIVYCAKVSPIRAQSLLFASPMCLDLLSSLLFSVKILRHPDADKIMLCSISSIITIFILISNFTDRCLNPSFIV